MLAEIAHKNAFSEIKEFCSAREFFKVGAHRLKSFLNSELRCS